MKADCRVFLLVAGLAVAVAGVAHAQASSSDWRALSLKLHAESSAEVGAALRGLKSLPHLDSTLRKELGGENEEAALDVIAALSLKELVPDLLRRSERDDDGFVYACLNALLNRDTRDQIVPSYLSRIGKPGEAMSAPAKVAVLEGLRRARAPLSPEALGPLLSDPDYQVRLSAVEYLEALLPSFAGPGRYVTLLKKSLVSPPYQLRLASIHILASLTGPVKAQSQSFAGLCAEDPNPIVRKECRKWGASR